MIIPSIDLADGRTVQLVGGREPALAAGDPAPWARRFGRVGEVAVIDLDRARGRGDNTALIEPLLREARCRVGGGIRDLATARRWLDRGAARIILGTAAAPALLRQLPRERVIVALDAEHGEVMSHGWQRGTGRRLLDRVRELRDLAGGFLITRIEREGRLAGMDLDWARELQDAAGDVRVTVAGGVATAAEVADLDRLGLDAQVGMALYTGRFTEADALAACLRSDRADGLWPTVVCDEHGRALGLAHSDAESLAAALAQGRGIYRSRSRGPWIKGESSGATQDLLAVDLDCDRDCLRFTVRQHGAGFCHTGAWTCFGPDHGLPALARRLRARTAGAPDGSYTARLLGDDGLLASKLQEEAGELAAARTSDEVVHEAADVLYFTMVSLARAGVGLDAVAAELDRRARRATRRPGDARPPREGSA